MRWIVTFLAGFAFLGHAQGHVLDEYLQATYIAVQPNRIDVEINMTPGVEVFQKVLRLIDRNGDGKITEQDMRAYAESVLSSASLDLDGSAKLLEFAHVTLPARADLEAGLGTICIQAKSPIAFLAAGRHHVEFRNAHAASISVYQVNALVPSSSAIRIAKQDRDRLQREYRMDFEVSRNLNNTGDYLLGGSIGGLIALAVALVRQRHASNSGWRVFNTTIAARRRPVFGETAICALRQLICALTIHFALAFS